MSVLAGIAAGAVLVWGTVALTVMPQATGPSPSAISLQGMGLILAAGTALAVTWSLSRHRWVTAFVVAIVIAFACVMLASAY